MGLWYLTTILFLTFTGLFWVYSPDRINVGGDYKTATAGLVRACQQAGVEEAYGDGGFGSTGVTPVRACRFGFPNLRRSELAKNLNVPGLNIIAYKATDVGDTNAFYADKRSVVTYLLPAGNVNGVPFNEVARQVQSLYGDQISTGIVSARAATDPAGTYNKITGSSGLLVRVPQSIPVGSLAMASVVDTAGWPAGCTPSSSGATCLKSFPAATASQAATNCQADGGYLAKINSVNDMNDIFAFGGGDPSWGYWVDGFDTNNNSQFNYNGTNTPLKYYDLSGNEIPLPWNAGEPNNAGGQENCINMYSSRRFNDLNCNDPNYSIPYVCMY